MTLGQVHSRMDLWRRCAGRVSLAKILFISGAVRFLVSGGGLRKGVLVRGVATVGPTVGLFIDATCGDIGGEGISAARNSCASSKVTLGLCMGVSSAMSSVEILLVSQSEGTDRTSELLSDLVRRMREPGVVLTLNVDVRPPSKVAWILSLLLTEPLTNS